MIEQLKYLTPRAAMWLVASEFMGLTEIPGEANNPTIMLFFADTGYKWVQGDETAWCSCFINYVALKCGVERSGKLDARSWLKTGQIIQDPELGDLVVYWRESRDSWKGHVGLYGGNNKKHIWTLGGNQNGQVNVSTYPIVRKLKYIRLPYAA